MIPFVLLFAPMQRRSVLFAIVFHVGAVKDALDPLRVFKIPVDGLGKTVFKADPGVASQGLR